MTEEPIIRETPKEQEQWEGDHACQGFLTYDLKTDSFVPCENPATYRLTYKPRIKTRNKSVEKHLCDEHLNRWKLSTHRFAYSIRKLKPDAPKNGNKGEINDA